MDEEDLSRMYAELDKVFEGLSYEQVKQIYDGYAEKRVNPVYHCSRCNKDLHFYDCEKEIKKESWEEHYGDEDVWVDEQVAYLSCPRCKDEIGRCVVRLTTYHLR